MGWSLFPIRSLMGQFWPTKFQIEPLQNSSPNRHWTQPLWVFECLRKCDSHEFRLIPTHSTHISAQTFFSLPRPIISKGWGRKKKADFDLLCCNLNQMTTDYTGKKKRIIDPSERARASLSPEDGFRNCLSSSSTLQSWCQSNGEGESRRAAGLQSIMEKGRKKINVLQLRSLVSCTCLHECSVFLQADTEWKIRPVLARLTPLILFDFHSLHARPYVVSINCIICIQTANKQ